jgi:hypothetical protein
VQQTPQFEQRIKLEVFHCYFSFYLVLTDFRRLSARGLNLKGQPKQRFLRVLG